MKDLKTNSRIEREISEQGFDVNVHRFPYTYHHDYVRKGNTSRADIAIKLRDLCTDNNQYDYSACYGAILYLISEQPHFVNETTVELLHEVKELSIYKNTKVCGIEEMQKLHNVI